MIEDCYINNLAKNLVPAVFRLRDLRRSVSPKFVELCMETPFGKVTKTSVIEFCYWSEKLLLNASSSASTF